MYYSFQILNINQIMCIVINMGFKLNTLNHELLLYIND